MLNALPGWSQVLVRDLGLRAIEGAWTSITLTSERTGLLETGCTDCRETASVLLTVDALSKILHNHEPVTFADAAAISGGGRDVIYDPNSMRLVTLSIVSRN